MPTAKKSTAAKPPHTRINFDDRISAAAEAKKAVLARFLARPKVDDPEFQQRQAELKSISDAREIRTAERKATKAADAARLAAEKAAADAARREEEQRKAIEAKAAALALEAERKAARDARYAARKAKKKK